MWLQSTATVRVVPLPDKADAYMWREGGLERWGQVKRLNATGDPDLEGTLRQRVLDEACARGADVVAVGPQESGAAMHLGGYVPQLKCRAAFVTRPRITTLEAA